MVFLLVWMMVGWLVASLFCCLCLIVLFSLFAFSTWLVVVSCVWWFAYFNYRLRVCLLLLV